MRRCLGSHTLSVSGFHRLQVDNVPSKMATGFFTVTDFAGSLCGAGGH